MNKLDEIGNKNPFTVPENYFLNVNDEIMSRLPEKKKVVPEKVTMWKKIEPWFYMAAMFIGAFFMIQTLQNTAGKKSSASEDIVTFSDANAGESHWSNVQISEEEFYEYLEEQLINDGYYDYMYNQVSFN